MEPGTIERELYVEASPDVVFEVVSSPEHVRQWWPDEARYEAVPGSDGEIVFGDPAAGGKVVRLSVLEVEPPHTFTFRWTHEPGEVPGESTSLLVTFALTPSGSGTQVRMTETGFRERGWAAAVVEAVYEDHVRGWDHFLPRLVRYAATLEVRP
jgi:uncharacterized protein YndB with AHSA1/START domain